MYLLQLYLYDEMHLTDLMLVLTACFEAPAIVSQGIANEAYLASSVPLFADFGEAGEERFCKLITVPTSNAKAIATLRRGLATANMRLLDDELLTAVLIPLADAAGRYCDSD